MSRRKRRKPITSPTPSVGSPAPWKDGGGSFGSWLKKQREIRKLTLREVSDATKIGMRYLEALEEDRFEVLPATIFAKGFLRNYAQYVGLDPDEVVNYFLVADAETRGEDEAEDEPTSTVNGPADIRVAIVGGAVLLLLVVFLFYFVSCRSDAEPTGETPDSEASQENVASVPPTSQPTTTLEAQSLALPVAETPPETVAEPSAPLRVTLSFVGDCWVEAVVDGRRRVSELRVQGESVQLEAESSVALKLGAIESVRIEVNEKPYLALEGRRGMVRETIDLSQVEPSQAFNQGARVGQPRVGESTVVVPASVRFETGRPLVLVAGD